MSKNKAAGQRLKRHSEFIIYVSKGVSSVWRAASVVLSGFRKPELRPGPALGVGVSGTGKVTS